MWKKTVEEEVKWYAQTTLNGFLMAFKGRVRHEDHEHNHRKVVYGDIDKRNDLFHRRDEVLQIILNSIEELKKSGKYLTAAEVKIDVGSDGAVTVEVMKENQMPSYFKAPTEAQWLMELSNQEEITSWAAMLLDEFMRATEHLCPVARAKAIKKKITLAAVKRHTKGNISVDPSFILGEAHRLYGIIYKFNEFSQYHVHLYASNDSSYVIEAHSSGKKEVIDRHQLSYEDFVKSCQQAASQP